MNGGEIDQETELATMVLRHLQLVVDVALLPELTSLKSIQLLWDQAVS